MVVVYSSILVQIIRQNAFLVDYSFSELCILHSFTLPISFPAQTRMPSAWNTPNEMSCLESMGPFLKFENYSL
jgi:hypothetical protein